MLNQDPGQGRKAQLRRQRRISSKGGVRFSNQAPSVRSKPKAMPSYHRNQSTKVVQYPAAKEKEGRRRKRRKRKEEEPTRVQWSGQNQRQLSHHGDRCLSVRSKPKASRSRHGDQSTNVVNSVLGGEVRASKGPLLPYPKKKFCRMT